MNSRIKTGKGSSDFEINFDSSDELWAGTFLERKLASWCEADPRVLMFETSYIAMSDRSFVMAGDESEKAQTMKGDWRIEFHIIRASSQAPDKLFDGVFVLGGSITPTIELEDGVSKNAYLLRLASRSVNGEKVFRKVSDLWRTLTTIGLRQNPK